jgi:PhnB protein
MHVQSYLYFDGRCEEALDFYKKTLGAKVEMMVRFKDSPEKNPMCTPENVDKVMHTQFKIGDTTILASDGRNTGNPKFDGFALAINAKDEAEVDKLFNGLADGGKVTMPLTKTFFSPRFGMLADKFGVNWILLVAQ